MQNKAVPGIWLNWLLIVCLLLIVFGLALVFLPDAMQNVIGVNFYNWPLPEDGYSQISTIERNYHMFLYGITGGMLVGWGVLLTFVANGPLKYGSRWAWGAMVICLAIWYVLDTGISLATGFSINAIFNSMIAVSFAVPLLALRPHLKESTITKDFLS